MKLIESLNENLNELNNIDLNSISLLDFETLDYYINKLSLTLDLKRIKLKSNILKNRDFDLIFELTYDNYVDLIELKKLYNGKSGIYILSFSNGKLYVGQTNNLCRRLGEYFDINKRCYIGHNDEIRELLQNTKENNITTKIYFKEAYQDLNILESNYIAEFHADDPQYGYNKTGGNY